MIERD